MTVTGRTVSGGQLQEDRLKPALGALCPKGTTDINDRGGQETRHTKNVSTGLAEFSQTGSPAPPLPFTS